MKKIKLKECDLCRLKNSRTNVVCGAGNKQAKILVIGEAPGKNEDEQAAPFVGSAGNLFDKNYLLPLGLGRKDIWLTNVVKCRPPNNRTPLDLEMDACKIWLMKEIEILKPKLIITLGNTAKKFIRVYYSVNGGVTIEDDNGDKDLFWVKEIKSYLFHLIHPAGLIYKPDRIEELNLNIKALKYFCNFVVEDLYGTLKGNNNGKGK